MPANPIIDLVSDALDETLRLLDSEHIPWDVTVTPRRLRRVLISASRPMPGYGPHEVGAGFLDHDGMYTWWQRFSGALFAWLFAERLPPLPTLEQLQPLALVPLDAVSWAEELHVLTNPQWYWDFAAQQLLEKQVSRVGAMRSPLKVIG